MQHVLATSIRHFDFQTVTVNWSARVWGRAQAHGVRRHGDWAVEFIRCAMVDRDADGHVCLPY